MVCGMVCRSPDAQCGYIVCIGPAPSPANASLARTCRSIPPPSCVCQQILDDSDDEDEDGNSDVEEEQQRDVDRAGQQRQLEDGGAGGPGNRPGSGAGAAKGVRHADSGAGAEDAAEGQAGGQAMRRAMTRKEREPDGAAADGNNALARANDAARGEGGEGGWPPALVKTSAGGGMHGDADGDAHSDVDTSDDGRGGGGGRHGKQVSHPLTHAGQRGGLLRKRGRG